LFYAAPASTSREEASWVLPSLRERLRESFPMLTTSLSTIAFVTVDVFMLSLFLPPAEVGIYAAAAKLVAFVNFPLMAVIGMIAPRFSKLDSEEDRLSLQAVFRQSTGFAFWSGLPVILAIALFPEPLLGLFGKGFEQATGIIYILLLGHAVTLLLGPTGYLLWMTGHAAALQRVTLLSLLALVLLCLILIPMLGIYGAAIAITAGLLIKSLGSWRLVIRHLNFNPLYFSQSGLSHAVSRK